MTRSPSPSFALRDSIADEIRERGPISFARFMERALYDARHGYYASGSGGLGPEGDFVTASDAGRAFGRCLARQLGEIDRLLQRPDPFDVVEVGAGRGLLARDLTEASQAGDADLFRRLRYAAIERSAAMRESIARNAPAAAVIDAAEPPAGGRVGCLLAVELFDALPVHRVRRRDGALLEVVVELGAAGELVEGEREPSVEVAAMAERYGAAADEGTEAEICLAALDELATLAAWIERGVLLLVDYGDSAERLYGGRRPRGTLLAYHRHRTNEEYLERIGAQDLTAHVNFTALEDRARELGLAVLGRTSQDRFLIANGLLEVFDERDAEAWRDPARVKQRLQARTLIQPLMGRGFQVLALARGVDPGTRLAGLEDPFVG